MSNEQINNSVFSQFHSLQINLISELNIKNLNQFHQKLLDLSDEAIQDEKLCDFLLLPLITCMNKVNKDETNRNDLYELIIKCILVVLFKFKQIKNLKIFDNILSGCSILMSPQNTNDLVVSEELNLECLKMIRLLVDYSSKEIQEDFYKFKNITKIGLLISISLNTLCASKSIQVRLESINCLKSLLSPKWTRNRVGIIFASFLPGISIQLVQKFLLNQNLNTLNHKLICASLQLFSQTICYVLNDNLHFDKKYYTKCYEKCSSDQINESIKDLIVNRSENPDWLNKTSVKLSTLIEQLFNKLIAYENENVKLKLVEFCSDVIKNSYFSLNKCINKFIKALATFAVSDSETIQKLAINTIKLVETKSNEVGFKNNYEIVSESLDELLLKIPRLIQRSVDESESITNDESRLIHLKEVYGYLKLIGESILDQNEPNLKEFFLSNINCMNKLILVLLNCVNLDYTSMENLYQVMENDEKTISASNISNYSGLKTYLADKSVYNDLSQICMYLGRSNVIQILIDQLLIPSANTSVIIQYDQYKLEILYLINLIMIGISNRSSNSEPLASILNLILNSLLNEFTKFNNDQISITRKKNSQIIQVCLVLETISSSSKCLSVSDFNIFLIETLYFILENYLSSNLLIRAVASKCLNELSSNLGYKSMQELLSANFDYIMNDLILKSNNKYRTFKLNLNKNEDDQIEISSSFSSVFVLCSLLEISNADIVPYLERLIDDYLFALEVNPRDFGLIMCTSKIMIKMARSIRRWYPSANDLVIAEDLSEIDLSLFIQNKKNTSYNKSFLDVINEINDTLFEYNPNKTSFKNTESETADEEEEQESNEKKIPLHINLQKKCMELCTHLISHPHKQIRFQVIDLVRELSKNLVDFTNEFLPLVHKLWQPICQRFTLDDYLVKSRIICLLFDLSVLCGEFISSRFIKEFLPRLCNFMSSQAMLSAKPNPTYIYSHAFKLQRSILFNIYKMCVLLEIKEMELENVIVNCLLIYLDAKQPKKLQNLAVEAIKSCSLIDSDIVWLCLHYIIEFSTLDRNKFSKFPEYTSQIRFRNKLQISDDVLYNLIDIFNTI